MKIAQIFESGLNIVHCVSHNESDRAVCGQDLAGDSANYDGHGRYYSEQTDKRINCRHCIEVIAHCKSIPKKYITTGKHKEP